MAVDFMAAAFPWIVLGLFAALSCSLMNKTEN